MLLAVRFFSINDVFLVPLCIVILYAILRSRAKFQPKAIQKLYYGVFWFKVVCVFGFALVSEYYFGGGDTALYYKGIQDLRIALSDNPGHALTIIQSPSLSLDNPLSPYFLYDNYGIDITYNYMESVSNFFVLRLGIWPAIVFFNSYLCISLCFSFFALGGALRLFKTFYYYYPTAKTEISIAALFLPSIGFWSGGLLKDTITFGCVGFIMYGILNIVIRKKKIKSSVFWVAFSGYLLFMIKAYIFLILMLAIIIWIFAETNKLIKDRTLRRIFAFMSFFISAGIIIFLLQYLTSQETLRQYKIENFISNSQYYRSNYEMVDNMFNQNTSYYSINTSNPFLLVVNSIGAVFFRPYLWEVNSAAAVLSAVESLLFLMLTLYLFFKKGLAAPFRVIFADPRLFMALVFAIIFAIGTGASTANFGALSRYKIPCVPFYLITIFLVYRKLNLPYPKLFTRVFPFLK